MSNGVKKLEELLFGNNDELNNQIIYNTSGKMTKDIEIDDSNLEIEIKNKLSKIISSLKSFNINLNTQIPNQYSLSNTFTYKLLETIVELIWKLEEEYGVKINYLSKFNSLTLKIDEYEKKIKKQQNEISKFQKEIIDFQTNSQKNIEKEKGIKSRTENEIQEIKSSNKKMTSLLNHLKNDIKKKEQDYFKLQEKLRKVMSDHNPNKFQTFFEIEDVLNKSNTLTSKTPEVFDKNLENKISMINKQNDVLFEIISNFKKFSEKYCKKINNHFNDEKVFVDMMKIKEGLFSNHLIGKNLSKFREQYINNLEIFEKILNRLIDESQINKTNQISMIQNNNQIIENSNTMKLALLNNDVNEIKENKDNSLNNNNPKLKNKDPLLNFKKWSMNDIIFKPNKKKNKEIEKWYENIDHGKNIVYELNNDNLIKGYSLIGNDVNEN